jgi:hypothetical protein
MTTYNFAELRKQAEEAGLTDEIMTGEVETRVGDVRVTQSVSTNRPQIGIKHVVTSGPHEGRIVWHNITLNTENPKAIAMFFRNLADYGVPADVVDSAQGLADIAPYISGHYKLVLRAREWNGQLRQDVAKVTKIADSPLDAFKF